MSLRLIQYHCGRLLETIVKNPQVGYHTRRIGEVAGGDINQMARTVTGSASIWWRRVRNRYNLGN